MSHRHVTLSLVLAALLMVAVLPASAQDARQQASLTDLLGLLQSDEATAEELKTALARVEEILGFQPPPCEAGQDRMFNDVPASSPFCPFIEEMARRGITSGCGNNNFCPGNAVTRAQMATFIVKTLGEPTWHEIGAPGEPEFDHPDFIICNWGNFDQDHSSAAFVRDEDGFVHLKGVVQVDDSGEGFCVNRIDGGLPDASLVAGRTIFLLPEGFRPDRREVFTVLTNGALGRVTVYDSDDVLPDPTETCGNGMCDLRGAVVVDPPTTFANADQWLSLDGISFRCDPAEPACP